MKSEPLVLLSTESPGCMLRFERPLRTVVATAYENMPETLDDMENARRSGHWLAGLYGYEVGAALMQISRRPPSPLSTPLCWFGVFDAPARVTDNELNTANRAYAGPLTHEWSREDYRLRFLEVQERIKAGDVYQANLSFRSKFPFVGDPLSLFLRLREASAVPYAAYIDTGAVQVLSLSPELFFSVRNGIIETQPMKGTAARHADARQDLDSRCRLQESAKNRAENIMIVDLMRNDLGRLAKPGSVEVTELLGVRSYPTVHTMVSTIRAELASSPAVSDVISALMPAGSISGAPKRRAIEILASLESSPREFYCGAVGYWAPHGDASFNVAIRTLWLNGENGTMGIGGGVVADSVADDEYDECLLKATWFAGIRRRLGLIETLKWDMGFVRLNEHLNRMAQSSRVLRLPFDRRVAEKALYDAVAGPISPARPISPAGSTSAAASLRPLRVRLELSESGELGCTVQPLTVSDRQWRFVLSSQRVTSTDVLLAHKTTWRELYDEEWDRHCANGFADEVIFLNERGELTEGARTNLFVQLDGALFTPPVDSGLLPGILRGDLLTGARCREGRLTCADLENAEKIYLGNSTRGLLAATWHR